MENSIEENAGTDSLKVFHHMVTAVKNDGEVGLAYMKSVEIEKGYEKKEEKKEEKKDTGMGYVLDVFRR